MPDEVKFPDTELSAIMAAFEQGKAEGVIAFVSSFKAIDERKALYGLARRVLARAEQTDLDSLISVSKAAIADLISASEAASSAGEAEVSNTLKDSANAFSYNLSADIAECWPEDTAVRSERHLEAGLAAAEDCLRWRHELKKGPWSFSIAWWAQGAHQLSLGRAAEAIESFGLSRQYAGLVLADKDGSQDTSTDFGCVLADGYLGLAKEASGDPLGSQTFERACDAFRALMPTEGEVGDDARFGLAQLEKMRQSLIARGVLSESA